MSDDVRPIILVLCEDPELMHLVRANLRRSRILTAPARSLDAALSLLTQVAMDGCVLGQAVQSGGSLAELERALEACRPGALRLCLEPCHSEHLRGWIRCSVEAISEEVWRLFRELPPI